MPGVIMENGRNGSHTNHDRDQRPNGVNGITYVSEKVQDKGKGRAEPQQNITPTSPTIPNGLNGKIMESSQHQNGGGDATPEDLQDRINQLPPEIAHITQGYMPLSNLLSRLAQKTHNDLSKTILELTQMPTPASVVNPPHRSVVDDTSQENLNKKLRLVKFAQDAHTEWTKALVITGWSRRAEDVSRTIDLKIHLDSQGQFYESAIYELSEIKKGLIHARLPNPDLKTALEVLTTGKASWMPDLGYIQPPPLTANEILTYLENLNTILSIRLNLHDYDGLPLQFKEYTIQSGRVTFRVVGEFEVDLTIADETPESQFWFIDFRFLFQPSVDTLTAPIRFHIENSVNSVLEKDGLAGCYKYLHELVLTHKISEFRKQATDLARARWIETLNVEPLNRALSIQYWLDKYSSKGARSWIILGVHSGKRKDGRLDSKSTSRLFVRWFRHSTEVTEVDIKFDTGDISAECLLNTVIANHVSHILTSMHDNLRAKPLFANRELALSLSISVTDPADSELKVQLTDEQHVSIKIEPISGRFVFSPACRPISDFEFFLNDNCQNPAAEGHTWIERLRSQILAQDTMTRGLSVGWLRVQNPGLKQETLKESGVTQKDTSQVHWFRRSAWLADWYIALAMGMSGEQWLLIETADASNPSANNINEGRKITSTIKIPIKSASPVPTYEFLSSLNIFSAALISHYCNIRALHANRAGHMLRQGRPGKAITLPSIYIKLSELLHSKQKDKSARVKQYWKKDVVRLTFQGLEILPQPSQDVVVRSSPGSQAPGNVQPQRLMRQENAVMITEARMNVPKPNALISINEKVDKDIAFDSESGSFAFRLRSRVGESVIPHLIERLVRVERLVEFVQVLQKHSHALRCESVSLGEIVFTYGNVSSNNGSNPVNLDIYKATIDFGAVENAMALTLEKSNPHLRIVDHLNKVLNEAEGLDGVAILLPLTLPVLKGLGKIEDAWTFAEGVGEVFVIVRSTDSYLIRYSLKQTSTNPAIPAGVRKVVFEVRLRQRKGVPWWLIQRQSKFSPTKEADDIDEALKQLWSSKGTGWEGMRVAAVARASGVEELLAKMDEIIRSLPPAGVEAPIPVSAPAPIVPQKQTEPPPILPPQRPQQQYKQQQPTPNQSQSQSQSKGRKRELIEID